MDLNPGTRPAMTPSLRRTLLLIAVLLPLWAGWYGWQSWKTSRELNRLADVVRSGELDRLLSDPPEEVRSSVDLAIRGIVLRQGRDGRKNFELRADWATLDQKSSDVTVRDPDVFYTLKARDKSGENRTVRARSRIGRVENNSTTIAMSGDVRADSGENSLAGSEAVYRNDLRTLEFPGGAALTGEAIEGSAKHLVWNLNANTISGNDGVHVRWFPSDSGPAAAHARKENSPNQEQQEDQP